MRVINFVSANKEWLDFVCSCRKGKEPDNEYDIAIGPVADDTVYAAVQMYENGILDEEETLKRLKIQPLFNQLLFHTEKSLNYCGYLSYTEVIRDE